MFTYSTPIGLPPAKPRAVGANKYIGGEKAAVQVALDIIRAEGIDVVDVWAWVGADATYVCRVYRDGGVDYAGPQTIRPVPPEVIA